jgi:Protein of unknown function (DUF3887)
MKVNRLVMIGVLAGLLVAGCGQLPAELTGTESDAVLAYAEPKVDNLLAGLNSGDYAAFSRDFSDKMRSAMGEAGLNSTRDLLQSKIGNYVSRQVSSVVQQGEFTSVVYKAKFENEDGVTVRVVFDNTADHPISGLWFDSPKLREK